MSEKTLYVNQWVVDKHIETTAVDVVKGAIWFYFDKNKKLVFGANINPGYTAYEIIEQLIPEYIPEKYRGAAKLLDEAVR